MEAKGTRIIAVANEKGGVGKTAVALNVAAALSEAGRRVLVVDVDPQFNATRGLGVELEGAASSVYDVIIAQEAPDLSRIVVETRWPGLHLLPSHVDLSGAQVELADVEGRELRLQRLMPLCPHYDFIFLDTPPALSLLTINVFAFAREVLVPCQTHPYSYAALDDLLDTLSMVREEINPQLALLGIVATFYDPRTRVGRMVMERLQNDARFPGKVFKTAIRNNATVAESAGEGVPVVFFSRSSRGALDFRQLAKELSRKRADRQG